MSRAHRKFKRSKLRQENLGEFVLAVGAPKRTVKPRKPYAKRISTHKKKRAMAKATRKAQRAK